MSVVDVLNVGSRDVWVDGRRLRVGGRWKNRIRKDLNPILEELEGVQIVPVGEPVMVPAPAPAVPDNSDDLILILDPEPDDEDLFEEPPLETLIDFEEPSFDDKLLSWGITDPDNLNPHKLKRWIKGKLVAAAEDLGADIQEGWGKLKIADAIIERIMDVKYRR